MLSRSSYLSSGVFEDHPMHDRSVVVHTGMYRCSGIDYDCGNFGNWSSAQACFQYCLETVGYDVHRLDRDNDGIACELLR